MLLTEGVAMSTQFLIVVVVVILPGAATWLNDFGGSFSFSCPRGQSVSAISYLYREYNDDHVYNFTCSPVTEGGRESGCSWSGKMFKIQVFLHDISCKGLPFL